MAYPARGLPAACIRDLKYPNRGPRRGPACANWSLKRKPDLARGRGPSGPSHYTERENSCAQPRSWSVFSSCLLRKQGSKVPGVRRDPSQPSKRMKKKRLQLKSGPASQNLASNSEKPPRLLGKFWEGSAIQKMAVWPAALRTLRPSEAANAPVIFLRMRRTWGVSHQVPVEVSVKGGPDRHEAAPWWTASRQSSSNPSQAA